MKFIATISVVLFIGLWTVEAASNDEDYAREYRDIKHEVLYTSVLVDPAMTYFNLVYLSQIKKKLPEIAGSTAYFDISIEKLVELADLSPQHCGRQKFKEIDQMISTLCPNRKSNHSNVKVYLEDIQERFIQACSDAYNKLMTLNIIPGSF